jgi:cytochrome b6-f complex iron-sulfur subunit
VTKRKGTTSAPQRRSETPVPGPPETRRTLLGRLAAGLGLVAVAELAWVVVSFLRPRPGRADREDSSGLVVAGALGDFSPGSVTAFPNGRFHLVHLPEGGFLALSATCTHLGCTVPWDEAAQRFACPCHASLFDRHGDVLSPPAPRPLDLYPVRIENGIVKVDTRSPVRRSRFERAQVVTS